MRYVSWASDSGQVVTFDGCNVHDGGGPFYFNELTSELGGTSETFRAPRQDGATTYHTALDTRTINLTGSLLAFGGSGRPALAEYDRLRAFLHQAFAPHRWGMLTYYKEDEAVQVRCRPVSTPTIAEPTGTFSTVDIDFVTDSPYWESAKEQIVSVGMIERYWHFPWVPTCGAMGAFNRFANVQNPTAENIYPEVEIYTTGQHVTVTNRTTGEHITIEHSIAENQKLVVGLRDVTAWLWTMDESGVYGEREDVSHWMSLDSEPWGLRPGQNQIAVTNNVPEDTPRAFIRWRVPSLGV